MQAKGKRRFIGLLIIEFIILAIVLLVCVHMRGQMSDVPVDMSAFKPNDAFSYQDGHWVIEQSQLNSKGFLVGADASDSYVIHLKGPKIRIPKGDYTLTIQYNNSVNQNVNLLCGKHYTRLLKAETYILSKNMPVSTYEFTVVDEIPDFRIQLEYNNYGTVDISSITIQPNSNGIKRVLLGLFLIFALGDFIYLRREWIRTHRTRVMILSTVVFMLSAPMFAYGITGGHDMMFHLMRIEGIVQELRYHQFPVRMSSLWLDGYGYPVSVYYGDALLYIPAVLRLFGFSIMTSYKIFLVTLNAATVWIAYRCFRGIFKDYRIAVVTAVAYSIAPYRFSCLYARHAVGEHSAMIFFPVIALAMYRIYNEESNSKRKYRVDAALLATGMVGLLLTHTLSVEMATVLLALIALIFAKKTFTKNVMRPLIQAVIMTCLMGAFFLVPFLDYYMNVSAQINSDVKNGGFSLIQWGGAYLSDYFNVFEEPYGWNSEFLFERMALTPGLMLIAGLVLAIGFIVKGKASKATKLYTAFSVFTLWLASNLFPWDFLTMHVWSGISVVQFPWRFIGPANVFLALTLGSVLLQFKELPRGKELLDMEPELSSWAETQSRVENRRNRTAITWFLVCGALSMLVYMNHYSNYDYVVNYQDNDELMNWAVTSFFLREGTAEQAVPKGLMQNENILSYEQVMNEGTTKKFLVTVGEGGGTLELPVFNYKGYVVSDEEGNSYEISDGTQDLISVSLPSNYNGTLTVRFVAPWYWHVAELISLVTIVATVWMVYWKRRYEL